MALKTSLKEVEVVNDKLFVETARLLGTTKGQVESVIGFIGPYVAQVMRTGVMEGVMIPGFGKFKPKEKKVVAVANAKRKGANGNEMVWQALKGRNIVDRRIIKPDTDETV